MLRPDAALVLGAGALGIGVVLRSVRAPCAVLVCLAAGGLALGARLEASARAASAEPQEADVEGRVQELALAPGWIRVELADVVAVAPEGPRPPERLRILTRPTPYGVSPLESAVPATRLRARLRWVTPDDRHNPGGRERTRASARAGIGAVARLVHPALVVTRHEARRWRPWMRLHETRARIAARLVASGPGGGLLAALALGDRRGLTPGSRDALARLGVAHVLAVSGLHLGLVAGLAFAALRAFLRRSAGLAMRWDTRRLALAGACTIAIAYGLAAGWDVPVRRAAILLTAAALAIARVRPARRGDPLAAAALTILILEPDALFRAGPQLSFAAAGALVFAARRPPGTVGWLRRGLREVLRTSAVAGAATAPIAAAQLGNAAPFALGANALALPWTACVLLPAAFAAAALATCGEGGAAAMGLAALERLAAWSLGAASTAAARLPAGDFVAPPAAPWWLAATALALLAIATPRTLPRVVLATAVGVLLSVAPPERVTPAAPRMVVLDVGQGDATLVQGTQGRVLVDAGTALPGGPDLGRSVVAPALRALGVDRLDLLVASHADLDHRGGLPAVLDALPVEEVWVPHGAGAEAGFEALRAAARSRGIALRERGAGSPVARFGDLRVTPLWPPPSPGHLARNDRSLVLRIDVAGRRVLLPGDLEAAGEHALLESGAELRADVLKLAHHGSRTSSTAGLLQAVGAVVGVASAPQRSRFGMPHAEVRRRVRGAGAAFWWTGRDGAVLVGFDAPLWVRGFAER